MHYGSEQPDIETYYTLSHELGIEKVRERCKRMREWTSEWPSRFMAVLNRSAMASTASVSNQVNELTDLS